jgi:hypothetical protein
MITTIRYRLSRPLIFARLSVLGGPLSASGRLRVHRSNPRLCYAATQGSAINQQRRTGPRLGRPTSNSRRAAPRHQRSNTVYIPRPFNLPAESMPIARRPHPRRAASFNWFLCAIPRASSLAPVFVAAGPRKETSAFCEVGSAPEAAAARAFAKSAALPPQLIKP